MGLMVLKASGLKWGNVEYPCGARLPTTVAAEIKAHPNYKALLSGHYIAADGESVYAGLERRMDALDIRIAALETRVAARRP